MPNTEQKPMQIVDHDRCTGCGACANICPNQCVTMQIHESGFYRPVTMELQCSGCDECMSVCPVLQKSDEDCKEPGHVSACWHSSDDVRKYSSSGGLFSAIAEYVLDQGGSVFGAAFDNNFVVKHHAVHSISEIDILRRSKYVQSHIHEKTYSQAIDILRRNQIVFFVGTPCQIAGLNHVVKAQSDFKEWSKHLVTADIICHGVPSPVFWAMHLNELENRFKSKIVSVNFRPKEDKRNVKWGEYFLHCIFENGREYFKRSGEDFFYSHFMQNLYLQPSCYSCSYAKILRIGDLTLGDFWKIGKEIPFSHSIEQGISLILINTPQGKRFFHQIKSRIFCEERTMDEAIQGLSKLSRPAIPHPRRNDFKKDFVDRKLSFAKLKRKYFLWLSLKKRFKRLAIKVVGQKVVSHLTKTDNSLMKRSKTP